MKVGVFDSGVGGLSVAKSLYDSSLFHEIHYYGDTARVPYGSKDQSTITRYALEAVEFFNALDIDVLVVACNTVSVIALEEMRKYSAKPVLGVVEPGVMALENRLAADKDSKILVIATRSTIASGRYQSLIAEKGYTDVCAIATPLLVSLVEEGIHSGPILEEVFHHYFSDIRIPDVVVLGCTHFPLLSLALARYFDGAMLIHSGEAMVEWLTRHYPASNAAQSCRVFIYATENVAKVREFAEMVGISL